MISENHGEMYYYKMKKKELINKMDGKQADQILEKEIKTLIETQAEGEYWDFKREWYSDNIDLLHDIICMANSMANRDCYIIIGVEDQSYQIVGVKEQNRKNQQNIINLLHQKPRWAGGYIPEVYVKTIEISECQIDVIIIKQSNNTPFYLTASYPSPKGKLSAGAIYTRKGDTNTPKNETADLYDTELLWKRRFGLLYSPSQRAMYYLEDIDNWEFVDQEKSSEGTESYSFFYYKPDPDYTIYIIYGKEELSNDDYVPPKDVNDKNVAECYFYIFAFCNVSYHTDFSNDLEVVLYYKNIPLFSSSVECIDEGRTKIIPPAYWNNAYYIKNTMKFLFFKFVFNKMGENFSSEAQDMLLRVIPVYKSEEEYRAFTDYIKEKGFSLERIGEKKISGEALERLNSIEIFGYPSYGKPGEIDSISSVLRTRKDMVINFANPENPYFARITKYLQRGRMLVEWLEEWRKNCDNESVDFLDLK